MSNYKTDPANIYYTANFINSTNSIVPAEITQYKTSPIINSPGEYYLKINEFYISDLIIPLMIIDNQTFSVTIDAISSGGDIERVYVQTLNSTSNPAFQGFIFNLNTFVTMVNQALFAAHNISFAPGNPPKLYYDNNGIFSMIMDQQYILQNVEIWFNTFLGQKLSSFNFFYDKFENNDLPISDPNSGKVFRFVRNSVLDQTNFYPTGFGPYAYPLYKYDQPYPSLFLLSDIRRLLITSNQMPTLRQIYSSTQGQNANVTRGVLFTVPVDDSFKTNSASIFFTPAVQKLTDMVSQEPLSIIDLKVNYELKNGELLPVLLSPGSSFTVELAFIHKSIYDNAYTFNKLGL